MKIKRTTGWVIYFACLLAAGATVTLNQALPAACFAASSGLMLGLLYRKP